jgi:hypothetical protein
MELREGGYLDRARVIAIRKVTEQEPGKHKTLRKVKDHGDI